MGKSIVTIVPVGEGRYAILMVGAVEQRHAPGGEDDPHGYTEAELRRILANCYGLSHDEIDKRIATVRGRDDGRRHIVRDTRG
jgi:hypothetical protein